MSRALMEQALQSRESIPGLPNEVATFDREIAAGVGGRVYIPNGEAKPLPVLVYMHGGGVGWRVDCDPRSVLPAAK